MSFYDDATRAKLPLREQGRVSISGLMREFGLDQAGVEELIEELVKVQGVAVRTGNVLGPIGKQSTGAAAAVAKSRPAEIEPRAHTPKNLANRILQSKSALEGEREQVTVLFAVGRDADLRALSDALEQAVAGNGQAIGIVADAGTGKSRLCFEFLEYCRASGMRVFEGRAVAHGRNIPFLRIGKPGLDRGSLRKGFIGRSRKRTRIAYAPLLYQLRRSLRSWHGHLSESPSLHSLRRGHSDRHNYPSSAPTSIVIEFATRNIFHIPSIETAAYW